MNFLFESKYINLMEGISSQFGTTPLGILLFLLAILSLPVILTLIYRSQRRRQRQEQQERTARIIKIKSEKLGLSPAERELVQRLAEADGHSENAYLVLFDEPRFHAAAALLEKQDTDISSSSIAALRVRLGFRRVPAKTPHSTAMIPEGSSLLLRPDKGGGVMKAELIRIRPDGFEIQIPGTRRLAAGDSAVFQYQSSRGSFLFKSYCLKREGDIHLMRHQERLKQRQQRSWFRNVWEGPLSAGYFDREERFDSRFFDLGGGGASFINPEGRFTEGDFLELNFPPPGETGSISLRGRVIRSSQQGKRLHLVFEGINENQRDRILGSLFKPRPDSE